MSGVAAGRAPGRRARARRRGARRRARRGGPRSRTCPSRTRSGRARRRGQVRAPAPGAPPRSRPSRRRRGAGRRRAASASASRCARTRRSSRSRGQQQGVARRRAAAGRLRCVLRRGRRPVTGVPPERRRSAPRGGATCSRLLRRRWRPQLRARVRARQSSARTRVGRDARVLEGEHRVQEARRPSRAAGPRAGGVVAPAAGGDSERRRGERAAPGDRPAMRRP